jgi:TldD protein
MSGLTLPSRREVLWSGVAGAAVAALPGGLVGCAREADMGTEMVGPSAALAAFGLDEAGASRVLSELLSRGADFGDLYFQRSRTNIISLEDGRISRASASVDLGVGIRAVAGEQTGYAYSEDLSLEAMLGAARTAAAIARSSGRPGPQRFELQRTPSLYSLAVPWSGVGVEQKLPILRKVEAMARAADPSILKASVNWMDTEEHVVVVASTGQVLAEQRPMTRLWCQLTARRGADTVSNSSNLAARQGVDWYDARLATLVKQAVDRTLILFEARRPPAGEMPVLLAAGASGILLHEAIGHGLEADFNRKGVSIYSDKIGQKIAPDFVTIVDNGVLPHERGALAFDDEGVPCERTVLVEKGVLRSYLHDQISARHYKMDSTGSGRRESFRHVPMPRMRCTYMENGPHERGELIAAVKKGILAETFTNGQVQIGAGDYTFYIKNGWAIEDGKLAYPIKDVNIIGNGPESLRRVTMAANDAVLDTGGWTCGKDGQGVPVSQGLPTVLVSEMTVGGVDA